jgi:hypothetical protein
MNNGWCTESVKYGGLSDARFLSQGYYRYLNARTIGESN